MTDKQAWLLTYNAALSGLLAYKRRDSDFNEISIRACSFANEVHAVQFDFYGMQLLPKLAEDK